MTAITAITAQNTLGVTAVMPVPAEMVLAQIDAVVGDIGVDAVKIGMIGSPETAQAVAERLERLGGADRLRSGDGRDQRLRARRRRDHRRLRAADADRRRWSPRTLPELRRLTGRARTPVAGALHSAAHAARCAKGGHGEGETIVDPLVSPRRDAALEGRAVRHDAHPRHRLHAGQRDRHRARRRAAARPRRSSRRALRPDRLARGARLSATATGRWAIRSVRLDCPAARARCSTRSPCRPAIMRRASLSTAGSAAGRSSTAAALRPLRGAGRGDAVDRRRAEATAPATTRSSSNARTSTPRSSGCGRPESPFEPGPEDQRLSLARGRAPRPARQPHLPLPRRRDPPLSALADRHTAFQRKLGLRPLAEPNV